MVKYRCTNCLWEGTTNEMTAEGDCLLCPDCCAYFYPSNQSEQGPWEVVGVDDDDPNEDYGDF